MLLKKNQNKENIEVRISHRLRSIFTSIGQTIMDFYLETGVFFIGGFNATLVSWAISTDLVASHQPMAYVIAVAIISWISVEGLTVYLVGAAARTGNIWLWVFSVIFAIFLTFAHYMSGEHHGIAWYISLAVPIFSVIGYLAMTIKVDMETSHTEEAEEKAKTATRKDKLEDDQIAFEREQSAIKMRLEHEKEMAELAAKQAIKIAEAEAKAQAAAVAAAGVGPAEKQKVSTEERQGHVLRVARENPDAGPTKILKLLSDEGLEISLSTVKRDIKELNGKLHKVEA